MREKTHLVRVYDTEYNKFRDYCIANGLIMSVLVSKLIKEYLKTKIGGSNDDTIPTNDNK